MAKTLKVKPKAKRIPPRKVVERRLIATRVVAGGAALPSFYNMYQEYFSDGSSRVTAGTRVFGMVTGNKKVDRPELFEMIHACKTLLGKLESVCYGVDLRNMSRVERWSG